MGMPVPVRIDRPRPPGHREPRREDLRGVRDRERGPHLVLLCRDMTGWESLCRMVSAAHLDGTKGVPRFTHELLARHAEGVALLTGCRHGEVARRLLAGDRAGARAAMRWYTEHVPDIPGLGSGVFAELQHHLGPDDDLLVAETAAVAADLGLPTIVTGDAHYALAEDRELQDVLVAIRHGRTVEEAAHLRRHNGEYHLVSRAELEARPPGDHRRGCGHAARLGTQGLDTAVDLAARCHSPLREERRHFPAIPLPEGRTTDEQLAELCWSGVRGPLRHGRPGRQRGGGRAARPRAGRHRPDPSRGLLPRLRGPRPVRAGAGHPGPGAGERR